MPQLDILAFGAHPDDVELGCGGTILSHVDMGKKVGIVDLTLGELGTRGTPEIRRAEAQVASELLGVKHRENLQMEDGFFLNERTNQIKVIEVIRRYRPSIVLCNATSDRHPDHGRASQLVSDSCFLAGLAKIDTGTEPYRPHVVYHYIQDRFIHPDLVVDISEYFERKMEAIKAYESQFHNPKSDEPETYISSAHFLDYIEARAKEMGHLIGVKYGEGFSTQRVVGTDNLLHLK